MGGAPGPSDMGMSLCMSHYGRGYRISTLIIVSINFWRNSDLFKKKKIFLAQIMTELERFEKKENL